MPRVTNLVDFVIAHDLCCKLMDTKEANGYADAIHQARIMSAPASRTGIMLLKESLIASDGNLQKHGVRL